MKYKKIAYYQCKPYLVNCVNLVNRIFMLHNRRLLILVREGSPPPKWNFPLKVWAHPPSSLMKKCRKPELAASKVLRRSCSTEGCVPPEVVFDRRSPSAKGHLPQKVIFLQRSSSNKGRLPQKVVFLLKSSSTKGLLPPKIIFHQRLFSNKGRPTMEDVPTKVVFQMIVFQSILHL